DQGAEECGFGHEGARLKMRERTDHRGAAGPCQRVAPRDRLAIMPPSLLRSPRMADDIELMRLFLHSRRGMMELDVLLVPLVEEMKTTLDPEDQARYRKLLECEVQDMLVWLMQRGEPEDAKLRRIVNMILDRVKP